MKKPSIPAINIQDQKVAALLRPMKENIEILTGIRGTPIDKTDVVTLDPIFENEIKRYYEALLRDEDIDTDAAVVAIIKVLFPIIRNLNTRSNDVKLMANIVNEILRRMSP